ncbi:protein DDI1 homolog 2-like isoform X1 [Metopolophium dirhodum]|uniref:protein DDI1 homolog 2-like isoform X1 n=1 Tax=Metopolophium dirhodum TaxID=44670 RepID=UPI0029900A9B|nr:protein DDI1 homolog 2-like isoform X1 [Metopolophium dirhodum]
MKITVKTYDDNLIVLDVSEDLELINFKAVCEVETGIPSQETRLIRNGQLLVEDFKTMKDLGVREGDVIIIQRVVNDIVLQFDFSCIQVPGSSNLIRQSQMQDAEYVKNLFLSKPEKLALLKQNNPGLADALSSNKIEEFLNIMAEQLGDQKKRKEYDRKIAKDIRQKNFKANKEAAENIPKQSICPPQFQNLQQNLQNPEEFANVMAEQLEYRKSVRKTFGIK